MADQRRWTDWPPPSRPISVEGGIRARSRRGAIGEQWWSRRFIDVLESFGMSGRLARGRNYARRGQVLGFEIGAGDVTAEVQGSRPRPYKVRIRVLPLTRPQWRAVEKELAARALFRAKLLAGEMPPEIEEVFSGCGTPLFPRSARDMEMTCSCPDWGVPCKHVAAVCYVLAEAFDLDPFEILAWRGRRRGDLLAALRRLTPRPAAAPGGAGLPGRTGAQAAAGVGATTGEAAAPAGGPKSGGPLAAITGRPLTASLDDGFWRSGQTTARLMALPSAPAVVPDLLLRSAEPPDVRVRGVDLATLLAPAYRRFTASRPGTWPAG
jgi:uncharacterized Zn finger protein